MFHTSRSAAVRNLWSGIATALAFATVLIVTFGVIK
jgi:hypothetical protein